MSQKTPVILYVYPNEELSIRRPGLPNIEGSNETLYKWLKEHGYTRSDIKFEGPKAKDWAELKSMGYTYYDITPEGFDDAFPRKEATMKMAVRVALAWSGATLY